MTTETQIRKTPYGGFYLEGAVNGNQFNRDLLEPLGWVFDEHLELWDIYFISADRVGCNIQESLKKTAEFLDELEIS